MGFRGPRNTPKYCIFVYLFNFFLYREMDHLNIFITKSSIMTLNGVSIGKLIGDFSVKTCIEFIDVRVLDNNDHRKLGSRATYFRTYVISKCMVSGCHGVDGSSSVQFSCSVVSDSLRPHELKQTRPPCPSPRVDSNSCPLSWWCHPTILSSVVPFSSWLQSFPASGSFPMSPFFASGGQSIRISASASVLPMNIQDWFPVGLAGLNSLRSKVLSRVFSNTTVQKHQFFDVQLSLWFNSHIHTWLLEKPYLWLDGPWLAK